MDWTDMGGKVPTALASVAVSVTLVCSGVPAPAFAETPNAAHEAQAGQGNVVVKDGFTFDKGTDPTAGVAGVITGYDGTSREVRIPSEIDGVPVRAIGASAFKGKSLTKLVLNEGLSYIGESAFEDNRLSEVNIPASVTTIAAKAFRQAGSRDFTESISVTGMKGVKTLADGSFSGMYDVSLDVPAITSVNENAFKPQVDSSGYFKPQYARLYTGNGNKSKLEGKEGLFLVDPPVLVTKAVDADNGAVLKTSSSTGEYVDNRLVSNSLDSFWQKGQKVEGRAASDDLDGYARPKAKQDIELSAIDNVVEFKYKAFSIQAPSGIERTASTLSGKTLPGATVTLSTTVGKNYWDKTVVEVATTVANASDGSFSFDLGKTEKLDISSFKGSLQVSASIDNGEYQGKARDYKVSLGQSAPGIVGADLVSVEVKQGDVASLPDEVNARFTDKSSKSLKVAWQNSMPSTGKAGTFWVLGTVSEGDNSVNALAKVTVTEDEGHASANTDSLLKALEQARAMLGTAISSAQGGVDVDVDRHWVSEEVYKRLKEAIGRADAVAKDKSSSQSKVDAEESTLRAAVTAFESARKPGTKPGSAITSGSVRYRVYLEEMPASDSDFKLALKNAESGQTIEPVVKRQGEYYEMSFERVPFGTWNVVATEGYVPTVIDYSSRSLLRMSFKLSEDRREVIDELFFKKGIKVHYDVTDKGTTKDPVDLFYLPGEKLSELEQPYVDMDEKWVFDGFSADGKNPLDPTMAVEHAMTLTALYHEAKGGVLNENTDIDGYWKLGDFTYAQDTEGEYETRGKWMITGLSQRGKQKFKRNTSISLPSVTYLTGEGIDTQEVAYVGWSDANHADGAFEGLGVTGLNIPEGIEGIYPNAFYENNISKVVLPKGLQWVGIGAFLRSGVKEVQFNDDIKNIREGAFADNNLTSVSIPDSVKLIEPFAFSGNRLSQVKLPAQCEKIQTRAFHNNRLTRVEIPTTVTFIEDEAFGENGGKVVLRTPDGSNPHKLVDGSTFVINHEVGEAPGGTEDVDKSALKDLMKEAEALRADTVVSPDGSKVAPEKHWVPEPFDTALNKALIEANYQVESSAATAESVEAARVALDKALSEYKRARKHGVVSEASWKRLYGDTALDTMSAIADEGWADGSAQTVVLATSGGYWDALSASALAGAYGAPVLLTNPNELSDQVKSQIKRLGAKKVYITGGTAAVSQAVEDELGGRLGLQVERLGGQTAVQTSALVSAAAQKARPSEACVVATINGYYDALSVASAAYFKGMPVFLTNADGTLTAETVDQIKEAGYKNALIVGGTAAVSGSVEGQLESAGIASGDVRRLAGDNAWQTSARIAEYALSQGMSIDKLGIADGNGYWDALTGAALCGKNGSVLLLVPHDGPTSEGDAFRFDPYCIDTVVKKRASAIDGGYVFGGEAAVPKPTLEALKRATARA
ncbi:leucine-rich repeat protein [Eggerthellaceae bacterium zg-997]|nr:leucine-rich repeat protein [Eggerthellaceae bacterium zg-997]